MARQTQIEEKLKAQICEAFNELAELGYGESLDPRLFRLSQIHDTDKLKKILEKLRLWIFMNYTHAVNATMSDYKDQYGNIALSASEYMSEAQNGFTTRQRIAKYVDRFKYEAEAIIAAGLLLGLKLDNTKQLFSRYAENPYAAPQFAKASALGATAVRLADNGAHFGTGQTTAIKSLNRLSEWLTADSARRVQQDTWQDGNIIGYMVERGSNYPCSTCDDMKGFHRSNLDLPPYHANCRCYAYPVYALSGDAELF